MNSQNKMVYMQKILNPSSYKSTEMNKESLANIMLDSINKAVDPAEVPIKEKHVRRLIIGTFKLESGNFFWQYLPIDRLEENQIVCWKFCYILHKLVRDGHKHLVTSSYGRRNVLLKSGQIWHFVDGYGKLIEKYCTMLYNRLNFLTRHPTFPRDLKLGDNQLESIMLHEAPTADYPIVNLYFTFSTELFDLLEDLVTLQEAVLTVVEDKGLNSMTKVGQCHLYPLVACIQDSSLIYEYAIKCLFKCYAGIPEKSFVDPHKRRLASIHDRLKSVYQKASKLQYFKTLIQIPQLPDELPDFMVAANLRQHTTPKAILFSEPAERESPDEMLVNLDEEEEISPSSSMQQQQLDSLPDLPPLPGSLDTTASSSQSLPIDQSLIDTGGSTVNDSSHAETIRQLREEIKKYEKSTQDFVVDLALLQNAVKDLEFNLDTERRMHSTKKAAASNLQHQLNAAKSELSKLQEEYSRVTRDNEITQEAMKKLMKDLNELRGKQQQEHVDILEKQYQEKLQRDTERALAEQQLENQRKQEQEREQQRQQQAEKDKHEEDLLAAEMNSAEKIIREATKKIEELAEKSRQIEQNETKLQVNEKISEVCTNLMMAVKHLIAQSRILQKEIVSQENGKSASSTCDDFYKRNSKWTNGLISAAQEVALAAKNLVDVADRSMSGASKFTELAAAAHEIATATTQLVVASRVKADRDSEKLKNFSVAARQVNQCTTNVVEASRVCANLVGQSDDEAKDILDLSSMSLHQTKQKEIESQIKIMELEAELARERKRLGFLRRQHYEQEEAQQEQVPADKAEHRQV